jgi:hypothetical protein
MVDVRLDDVFKFGELCLAIFWKLINHKMSLFA